MYDFFASIQKLCYTEREIDFKKFYMRKNIILIFSLIILFFSGLSTNLQLNAADESNDIPDYTSLRDVDKSTFNEYRYYMVREYFKLKEGYDLNGVINKDIAASIFKYAKL
jgi:hypothetical protein